MTAILTPHTNARLTAAKEAKNNEFYTGWADIEKEMKAYLTFDSDVFRDKTILLPCDDPEWSNFTRFFVHNFTAFGLKKLISTSYVPFVGNDHEQERGRVFTLSRGDVPEELTWEYLEGNGDFRSEEVTALRDEADMVITNPPFSLFREFIAWIMEGEVEFSVIGNMNAATYKEIFPLIKNNRIWYGPSISSGDREFRVPDTYPLTATGSRVDETGRKFVRVKGVRWFTNIEHGRRRERLELLTLADNKAHSRRSKIRAQGYPEYDNYAAIEVAYTEAIPSDYAGVMGVPISFLDKYSPEQFEIVGATESEGVGFSEGLWVPGSGARQAVARGKKMYKRIFIRHKKGFK